MPRYDTSRLVEIAAELQRKKLERSSSALEQDISPEQSPEQSSLSLERQLTEIFGEEISQETLQEYRKEISEVPSAAEAAMETVHLRLSKSHFEKNEISAVGPISGAYTGFFFGAFGGGYLASVLASFSDAILCGGLIGMLVGGAGFAYAGYRIEGGLLKRKNTPKIAELESLIATKEQQLSLYAKSIQPGDVVLYDHARPCLAYVQAVSPKGIVVQHDFAETYQQTTDYISRQRVLQESELICVLGSEILPMTEETLFALPLKTPLAFQAKGKLDSYGFLAKIDHQELVLCNDFACGKESARYSLERLQQGRLAGYKLLAVLNEANKKL